MTSLIAAIGAKAVLWIGGAIALLAGGLVAAKAVKANGAATQLAADTRKGMDDVETTSKVRTDVDALGDARLDKRLQPFERK